MASKARKRKPTHADQSNGKSKDEKSKQRTQTGKSSNKTLIFLVVMVIATWGVAATAYFGVIDYKAMIARTSSLTSSDVVSCLSLLYPSQYPAFRHPFRALGNLLIGLDDFISSFFTVKGLEKSVEVEKRNAEPADDQLKTKKQEQAADQKVNQKSIVLDSKEDIAAKAKEIAEEIKSKHMKKESTETKKSEETAQKRSQSSKESTKTSKKTQESKAKKAANSANKKDSKTNPYTTIKDKPILKELEEGERLLDRKRGKEAAVFFQKLMDSNPLSSRAVYGKARALLIQAEQERNNQLLIESLATLGKVGEHPYCPDNLKKEAILTKIDKHHFLGQVKDALMTAKGLYNQFNRDVRVINKLGVCYLWIGKNDKAATLYELALSINPKDGFAQVHYGFIVKTGGDWVKGAKYLQQGIDSGEEGTQEGKFYLHLGDALYRTNRSEEANEIYQRAADKGMFLSKYQRSLYNVDRLKSHPFWTPEEAQVTHYVKKLEKKWKMIRDEALSIMDTDKGLFLPEEESLKNTGDWKQLTLYQRGKPQKDCSRLPKTCALVGKMPNAYGCTRGQIKFSIMQPGTHVWAHTGPTNCRLRMHLGLVIPKTGEGAKIRCAEEFRTWEEGKVLIFDDSFEHEVWQYAESYRLILIIDVWHPDLTEQEKRTLSPI